MTFSLRMVLHENQLLISVSSSWCGTTNWRGSGQFSGRIKWFCGDWWNCTALQPSYSRRSRKWRRGGRWGFLTHRRPAEVIKVSWIKLASVCWSQTTRTFLLLVSPCFPPRKSQHFRLVFQRCDIASVTSWSLSWQLTIQNCICCCNGWRAALSSRRVTW